ncbi:MAG: carboxypeptidase-like regulatory domain-containing protein [Flavobacterium sp.]
MAIIRGKVTDLSNQPLRSVHVWVKEKPNVGVITDGFGNFLIEMNLGQNLSFSHVGFENYTETVLNTTPKQIILFEDSGNELPGVTITAPTKKDDKEISMWWLIPLALFGAYRLNKTKSKKVVL